MIKKHVDYVDFNGNERNEDFYFNLTEAELTELELSYEGGLKASMEAIMAAQKMDQIVDVFKKIVLTAYGVKSPDGRKFIKNDDVREDFTQTNAYSEIFMELAFDDIKAAEFINGLVTAVAKKEIKAVN